MSFLDKIKSGKKNIKFYPLNSLTFTANPKYNDNKIFLSMKIKEILIRIYAIFFWPNPGSSYSKEMADEYNNNRPLYETKAKFFTIKYANPNYRDIIVGIVQMQDIIDEYFYPIWKKKNKGA